MHKKQETMNKILVTGSDGLVGTRLCNLLERAGNEVVRLDLRPRHERSFAVDVLDLRSLSSSAVGCAGIVHLAAVSRVVWGEADPEGCLRTNVLGTANVAEVAASSPTKPWVMLASSREVYGHARSLPVTESHASAPINVYGRSKLFAEHILRALHQAGRRAAVVRLSSVYGSADDHPDRVVPAFCRAALANGSLGINGSECILDFTHVDDVAEGILRMAQMLMSGHALTEPIHLVSGVPTSLHDLATLVIRCAGANSAIVERPPRAYDVSHFVGDPARATALLGWNVATNLDNGVARLLTDLRPRRASSNAAVLESRPDAGSG
jgi:nucleoside-diphosphate-sugar epimerase